jgi:hypothetical protein
MKLIIAILFLAGLGFIQLSGKSQPQKGHLRLGFEQAKDTPPIVDTDLFDEQKYIEEGGSDSSAAKAKRETHEAALTREFMDGFNSAQECDGVVFLGAGDNKPDFGLRIIVDSHDTLHQKPVWNWILRDVHTDKLMPVGFADSGKDAAKNICLALRKQSELDARK